MAPAGKGRTLFLYLENMGVRPCYYHRLIRKAYSGAGKGYIYVYIRVGIIQLPDVVFYVV